MERPPINQFCGLIEDLAKKESAEFDFHGFCQEKTDILFQKNQLKNCSSSETNHINIRALQGKKSACSYTKDFSREGLESCFHRALEALRLSDKEERGGLSESQSYEDFSAFYSGEDENMSIEEKIRRTERVSGACLNFNKAVQPVYSSVGDTSFYGFFANSRGLQSSYRSYHVFAQCFALAVQGESRANGLSGAVSRGYKGIDLKKIGKTAGEKAFKKLNYSIPRTKKYPVVFQAGQAVSFLFVQFGGYAERQSCF